MIITLIKADFSDSNIGSSTTWRITKTLKGVTCSNSATTITKGSTYSATFTVTSGYTFSSATVTMGGVDKTSSLVWNNEKTSATLTLATTETSGNIYVTITALSNSGSGDSGGNEEGGSGSAEYVSYLGADAFKNVGIRVQAAENDLGWAETTSGTSSAATDYLPVSSEDSIWIEYIAVVNNGLASGGFYDMNNNLVAPLYWGTFGIDQAANASAKFVTPENPVTIASVEEEWNCTIAYVRFIAWSAADGNSTGLTNTEARIYYAEGAPVEPTYTSYIGEDVFSFNKESFTNTGYTTSGSSSAYASDYLAITPEQGVWLQYIFTMSDAHRCIGLFDSNKTFIKSITAADFGLSTTGKFQTPSAPVKISNLGGTENVAYVRFVAWDTSDGGRANTEARIYSY